ncbi:thermonuclease family protein [Xanthobacter oligotrophicus]|uniref:thermonuclease family protein n=1 Tax=Xanthobacter oligotrophicus TaxID=2607286 RepID=UPI0039C06EBA
MHLGQATAIDGGTLEIHAERIRLHGIDAPESSQVCQRANGTEYRCGQVAALALADWLARAAVSCRQTDVDRWKRAIAVCTARGEDVAHGSSRLGTR